MQMKSAKFDIVVYGATGFTGQLVAEYLAAHYKNDASLKWAMAGRSLDKLKSVRDAIGAPADIPLIAADSGDPASLKAMIDQTRSVVTTVGPYLLYGNELVAACADSGTDYFDLCGEVPWMRRIIDAHQATAERSGARIMFSCGYDSLPFELGVFSCQEAAKKTFGAPVARVKGRVRAMKGTFSGGTAASGKAIFEAAAKDPSLLALIRDPFALTPGFTGPKQPPGNRPVFDEDLQTWLTPFFMANINTRNVHRSTRCWVSPTDRISFTTRCRLQVPVRRAKREPSASWRRTTIWLQRPYRSRARGPRRKSGRLDITICSSSQ
jgi:short subunit dehydrogenase-like uncharacterized protein